MSRKFFGLTLDAKSFLTLSAPTTRGNAASGQSSSYVPLTFIFIGDSDRASDFDGLAGVSHGTFCFSVAFRFNCAVGILCHAGSEGTKSF